VTTLPNRPITALLVIDVQNGVVAKAHRRDAVIAKIQAAVDAARRQGAPVIWIRHISEQLKADDPASAIVPELVPRADERVVLKSFGDAFESTALEDALSALGVGRLVVTGAQTDACIRATIHGAFARGYDTILVKDAHTTEDLTRWGAPPPEQVIAHTNLYWSHHAAPGRKAGTVAAEDVDFAKT
jgi:nicotinamidase-related amidase